MLGNPLYLFAISGLIIPIAIHLLSRKEGKVIKLGSVRHVLETSTQQFKGIKLNEILLLLLRCAMIIVFSLLLSGLQCTQVDKQKWVLIEKGLERLQVMNPLLDSLDKEGYDLHWLAEGFPDLKDSTRVKADVNYWKLAEQLKQVNLSQPIIFSKNNVNNFKGLRVSLPANIRWISQPMDAIKFPVRAVQLSRDSVLLIIGHTDSKQTDFTSEIISANASPIGITAPDSIDVLLVSDIEFNYDKKIIQAALQAIEKILPLKIKRVEADPSKAMSLKAEWCIWLSARKPVDINFGRTIIIHPLASNDLIIQTGPKKWCITKRLKEGVALDNNLTLQLAYLFFADRTQDELISLPDQRMIADSLAWDHQAAAGKVKASMSGTHADKILFVLLLGLLLVERITSYKKNQ